MPPSAHARKGAGFVLPHSMNAPPSAPNLLFIAGDLSGDHHTAMLAEVLRDRHPEWHFASVGGARLNQTVAQAAHGTVVGDTSGCGVISFVSALALVPRVLRLRRQVLGFLDRHPIDIAVLCDWGAFNGRLLPELQRRRIRVFYYFPPGSWRRSGQGGLGIAPLVERVATPFPWSAERLRAAGADAEWVGHPALETIRISQPVEALRAAFGVQSGEKLIALMPGSRALELQYIAPHVVRAAAQLRQSMALRFVAAVPANGYERARRYFPDWIDVIIGRTADLLYAADAAIVKSGTVTLEAAVAGVPMVVVYDGPPLAVLQWRLVARKVPFVAMPNIILQRLAVPELLAGACRGPRIAAALTEMLENPAKRADVGEGYGEVRRALGAELPFTATARTAALVEEMSCLPSL